MGRNPVALYKRDRINPHPKKPNKRPHKRSKDGEDDQEVSVQPPAKAPMLSDFKLPEMAEITPDDVRTQPRPEFPEEEDEDATMTSTGPSLFFGAKTNQEGDDRTKVSASSYRTTKELYAAPTREEMAELKQAQQLFKSNLFKLQIDEMVKEVSINFGKQRKLTKALFALKEQLEQLPSVDEAEVSLQDLADDDIRVPLLLGQAEATAVPFAFKAPSVSIIGSYLTKTAVKPDYNVDVALEMPDELFRDKDYLNNRYFFKRALYLRTIAQALQGYAGVTDVHYTLCNGNPLKPILVCRPLLGDGKPSKWLLRLLPSVSPDIFKMSKLGPDRNCLRHTKNPSLLPRAREQSAPETATARYNNAVLQDLYMQTDLEAISKWSEHERCTDFAAAVLLLKTWLRQRNMGSHRRGTLNGFAATMLLVHLLETRALPLEGSSYQMFRKVLSFLAESQLETEGVAMKADAELERPSMELLNKSFDVVFMSSNGFVNLLGDMAKATYNELRMEAAIALNLMDSNTFDGFEPLLMTKMEPSLKFDSLLRVRVMPSLARSYDAQVLDRGGNWLDLAQALICTLLTRGLGDRLRLVVPVDQGYTTTWALEQAAVNLAPTANVEPVILTFGLVLDSSTLLRTVDMGPAAEEVAEAQRFKEFWGEKSELRRFQDSSIVEAVVWDCKEEEQSLIFKWIILHLLQRHARLQPEDIFVHYHPLTTVLSCFDQPSVTLDRGNLASQRVLRAFEHLAKQMRRLSLPLGIVSMQGVSPTFRYSDPCPPYPSANPVAFQPALEVVLQLEASGKWPEDRQAMALVKTAFYVKIAEALDSSQIDCVCSVTKGYLDVQYDEFVFRFALFVERELILYTNQHQRAAGTLARLRANAQAIPEGLQAEVDQLAHHARLTTKSFLTLPAVTGMLHAYHLKQQAFGPTCRLVKRWAAAHLFSSVIEDEAFDLLTLAAFGHHSGQAVPASATTGFARFLRFMTTFDFENDAVIVDPQESLTQQTIVDVQRHVRDVRNTLPPIVIVTPYDQAGDMFTSPQPTSMMLRRLVAYAKISLEQYMELSTPVESSALVFATPTTLLPLFNTPLAGFDLVVKLKAKKLPRVEQGIHQLTAPKSDTADQVDYKNLALGSHKRSTRPGLDYLPELVSVLQAELGSDVLLFYDQYGGDRICVSFNPKLKEARDFNMARLDSSMPVADASQVQTSLQELTGVIQTIAGDLIHSITFC